MSPRRALLVLAAVCACGGEPRFEPPDRAVELERMQGTWRRGDSGCTIEVSGASLRETCPRADMLLYGDRWYVISFPQVGMIKLYEGGSYHEYGYARDRGDIYLGAGGGGRSTGDTMIAAPFDLRMLLTMTGGRCRQHARIDRGTDRTFDRQGFDIACEVSGPRVVFHAVVEPTTGYTRTLTYERIGDAVMAGPVRRNRLLRE